MKKANLHSIISAMRKKETVFSVVTYVVLTCLGFSCIYLFLYMIVHSFFSPEDIADVTITWVPSGLYFGNFKNALSVLDFFKTLGNSMLMSVGPALLQVVCVAFVGFGLARYKVPCKRLLMILIGSTFLIPSQITTVPRYVLYNDIGILNKIWVSYLPAALGQGMKSAIFIFLVFQACNSYPKAFDEAAMIDGANEWKIFYKIAMPMCKSPLILSFLFSLVWYWNEITQSSMFFGKVFQTLPMRLQQFQSIYESQFGAAAGAATDSFNDAILMAGTLLSVLPIFIFYFFSQKQFVQSIERSGITGE